MWYQNDCDHKDVIKTEDGEEWLCENCGETKMKTLSDKGYRIINTVASEDNGTVNEQEI